MKNNVKRVFLRVSPDARPSSIDLRPVEQHFGMTEPMALTADHKDLSVYFFELPHETEDKDALKLMNDLADQASVDEVWDSYLTYKEATPAQESGLSADKHAGGKPPTLYQKLAP